METRYMEIRDSERIMVNGDDKFTCDGLCITIVPDGVPEWKNPWAQKAYISREKARTLAYALLAEVYK